MKNLIEKKIDFLIKLHLKIGIVEGYLNLSNTSLRWREDLTIKLNESYLDISENEVNLIGKLIFEFRETKNFYSFYQVKKDNRKDIKNIEIDFLYNLNNNNFNFDNPKINNKFNMSLEKLIEKFNRKKNRFFNKITFKNFINEFFKAYAG